MNLLKKLFGNKTESRSGSSEVPRSTSGTSEVAGGSISDFAVRFEKLVKAGLVAAAARVIGPEIAVFIDKLIKAVQSKDNALYERLKQSSITCPHCKATFVFGKARAEMVEDHAHIVCLRCAKAVFPLAVLALETK